MPKKKTVEETTEIETKAVESETTKEKTIKVKFNRDVISTLGYWRNGCIDTLSSEIALKYLNSGACSRC